MIPLYCSSIQLVSRFQRLPSQLVHERVFEQHLHHKEI